MSLTEKKITSRTIYDGKVIKVQLDDVELPDGKIAKRECVRHSGGAAVLFVKDNKIALVKQFRYLYNKVIYEIPAGKLNEGEDPMTSAARELEEETGYRPKNITKFLEIYPTPGYTDEIIHIYKVTEAEFVGQHLDDDEFLQCAFYDDKEVLAMIENGIITDAKTISAVYKYFYELAGRTMD